ncbi:MAG: hypothetical protein J5623_04710 [Clostridiales bacterium]|nr:hypothetical protein [Clostridiales bacterium]
MAAGNSRKSSSSRQSSTRRPSSSGRKPANGRQATRSGRSAPQVQQQPGILERVVSSPIMGRLAAPLIVIAGILVLVGIDLLISWNDFSRFFKILGIELLVAVIVWILKLVFAKSKSSEDQAEV